MRRNREGFFESEDQRECTNCGDIFTKKSKTVTLCNHCNSDRVINAVSKEYKLFNGARQRAKLLNREFNLELTDIIIPEMCPILNIPLIVNSGKCGGHKNSPTLDRIDNNKGYIKGNVRVISRLANSMKTSANDEELKQFANWIIKNL